MTRTTILGQGRMGSAMALRLLEHGTEVTVWNRRTQRCEAARAAGAAVADTPAKAVADAEVVLVMLSDGPAVTELLTEVAPALPGTAVLVQLSTISPEQTRNLAANLPAVPMLDAPVKGSVPQVLAGSLVILAGGDDARLEQARTVLERLGTIEPCGDLGDGSAAKLVVNAAMIGTAALLTESLTLSQRLGLSEDAARELLTGTPLGPVLKLVDAAGNDFPVYLAAKDVRLAHTAAPETTVFHAVAEQLGTAGDPQSALTAVVKRRLDAFDAN